MKIGSNYLIFTMSWYWVGKLVEANPDHFVLDQCSRVNDTGEDLTECVKNGTFTTAYWVGDGVIVPRGGSALIPWPHKLAK